LDVNIEMTIELVHTCHVDGLISMRWERTQLTLSTSEMARESDSRAPGRCAVARDADVFTYKGQSVDSVDWRREIGNSIHDVIDSALRALSNGTKLASNSPTSAEI
jgi:hypothetical protein